MKANEAQEKIWLGKYTQNLMLSDPNSNTYVEYVRKDTFVEKACKFLDKELPITDLSSSNMLDITFKVFDKKSKKVFIKNFKAYMKGE